MPAPEPLRFGRKRALPSCPNPLFLQWLTELRDEAREKGLKIQYTYQKLDLAAYECCASEAEKEKLLSNVRYGKLKRNLGPALSRTVYQLYCTEGALTQIGSTFISKVMHVYY